MDVCGDFFGMVVKKSTPQPKRLKTLKDFIPSCARETETMSTKTRFGVREAKKWVGAHLSISGGLYNAVIQTTRIEGNAFALFLKSQRTFSFSPITQDTVNKFRRSLEELDFCCSSSQTNLSGFDTHQQILPHGSYLINLGNPDAEKRTKSYRLFLDDLKRCDMLCIGLYNFHPGSTCGLTTREHSISLIAEEINRGLNETKQVKVVLENMAGQGNIIGSRFEDLADIISLVEQKSRIGVCLDTCHLFAAGYDIRTADAWNVVLDSFDKIVGQKYLCAVHLNDSKGPLGCKKDRHENLGKGQVGIECFKFIMRDPRFRCMPLVLETPVPEGADPMQVYAAEIQMLYSFLDDEHMC